MELAMDLLKIAIGATALAAVCMISAQASAASKDEEALTNTIGLDYIYAGNPNGKFGEYNGLDEDQNNAVLRVDWFERVDEAPEQYWDLNVHNLGLDTFFVKGEYGMQGLFRVRAGFDQLQKIYHEDAFTIYDGKLNVLPAPREKTTSTKRKTASLGFDAIFAPQWELKTDFRSQKKEGDRPRPVNGGLIVPQNVDFEHDEIETSLTYKDEQFQLVIASYISNFKNDDDLILSTAAEPDNSFYQFSVKGGYNINSTSRATAYLSYSEGEQDDSFSKYGIPSGTFSANSLDAEYDTINFQLGYRNRPTPKLSLNMNYRLESRDNDTPLYSDFPSDKNNKVYEWDKHKFDLSARYRLPERWRLKGGVRYTDYQYKVRKAPRPTGRLTEQAGKLTDDSEEWTTWAEIRTPLISGFNGRVKYSYSDRDVDLDSIRKEAATSDPGGVALSSYLTDRERDKINILLSQQIGEKWSLGFNTILIDDDYDGIAWASLDHSESEAYTLDLTYSPHINASLNLYAGIENFDIKQSGFGTLGDGSTKWKYKMEDETDLFGFTARLSDVSGWIDLRLDYRFQEGEGNYKTKDPTNVSGDFPDLETTINRVTLNADFHFTDHLTLNTSFVYEDYDSDSWVWKNDVNEPGTTYFDTLDYGYDSPDDISRIFLIGATYHF
jgi:MtrB/PioB family decaheme-associated outer membrane protein